MTSAIISNGSIYISGKNFQGGIYTTFTILPAPVGVSFTQIAVSKDHLAAVDADGTLWTIGNNDTGKLGLGDNVHRTTLTQVVSGVKFVACDKFSTAILDFEGNLYIAGKNFMFNPIDEDRLTSKTNVFTYIESLRNFKFLSLNGGACLLIDDNNKLFGTGRSPSKFGIVEDDIKEIYQNRLTTVDQYDTTKIQNVRDEYNIAEELFNRDVGNRVYDFVGIIPELSFKAAAVSLHDSWAIDMDGNLYNLEKRVRKESDRKLVSLATGVLVVYCIDENGDVFFVGRHISRRKEDTKYLNQEPIGTINNIIDEIANNDINNLLRTGRLFEITKDRSKIFFSRDGHSINFLNSVAGGPLISVTLMGVADVGLIGQLNQQLFDYDYGLQYDQLTQLTMKVPMAQLTFIGGTLFLLDYNGNIFVFGQNKHAIAGIGDTRKITEIVNIPGAHAEILPNQNDIRMLVRRFLNTKAASRVRY